MYDDPQNDGAVKQAAKEVGRQAANQAKREAKKAMADALKKALLALVKSPYFWIAIGIILLVVILLAGFHYVVQKAENAEYVGAKEKFTTPSGFFEVKKTIWGNKYYKVELTDDEEKLMDDALELIDCNPDDYNKFEKYVLMKIANVRRTDSNNDGVINEDDDVTMDKDLSKYSEEELHMFPLFVKAELKNLYPNLDPEGLELTEEEEKDGKFQGNVLIERDGIKLQYKPMADFDGMIASGNENVLKYFSLDDDFNLAIASKETRKVVTTTTGDPIYHTDVENSETITFKKTTVPYMQTLEKIAVPYPVFNILFIITEDSEFCTRVAKLACESQITLGVFDETTTVTTTLNQDGTAQVESRYTYFTEYDYTVTSANGTNTYTNNPYTFNSHIETNTEDFSSTKVTTTTTSNPKVVVQKADTIFWYIDLIFKKKEETQENPEVTNTVTVPGNNQLIRTQTGLPIVGPFDPIRQEAEDEIEGSGVIVPPPIVNNDPPEDDEESNPLLDLLGGLGDLLENLGDLLENIQNPVENLIQNITQVIEVTNIDFLQTISYRQDFLLEKTIVSKTKENIKTTTWERDDANSKLEFKGEQPEYRDDTEDVDKSFYDILVDEKFKLTKEHIYELQDRLEEFFKEALSTETAQTYSDIFEYMKYLLSGSGDVTDVSSILNLDSMELTSVSAGANGLIMNAGASQAAPRVTKEQLQTAIEATYSNAAQRNNLLSAIDAFMQIQTQYNVNPLFAIAIAQKESSCGTKWEAIESSTHNWMSITYWTGTNGTRSEDGIWCSYSSFTEAVLDFGKYINERYFAEGKNSITDIGNKYCPNTAEDPTQADEWISGVSSTVVELYNNAGISISSHTDTGDGRTHQGTYTDSNGHTFTLYRQGYFNQYYWGGTIAANGCGPSSCAIVLTGYGYNETPATIVAGMSSQWCGAMQPMIEFFNRKGFATEATYNNTASDSYILRKLNEGYKLIVNVQDGYVGGYPYEGHYYTILDVKPGTTQVFVGDPGPTTISRGNNPGGGNNGWYNISSLTSKQHIIYIKK